MEEDIKTLNEDDNDTSSLISDSDITDWENPPKLSELKDNYTEAKVSHDIQVANVITWLDNLNITGKARINTNKNRSAIVPKLIRKQAEWRYASLSEPFLSTDDIFNTDPVTYEDKKAAVQNGLVLNSQFNKLNKVKFIDDYVRAAVNEGTVITRVGWEYEEKEEEVVVPDFNYAPTPEAQQKIQELAQLQQTDPITFKENVSEELQTALQLSIQNGVPMLPIKIGEHTETQTKVITNSPTLEVCNIKNVIIDPTAMGDSNKISFIIYSFETSLSKLKKDGNYINLDNINISNTSILNSPDHYVDDTSSFNFNDKPRQKFVAYEYWGYYDIHGTGIVEPIIVTWVNDVIIRMEENPFPDKKLPFVIVPYLPILRSIYGEPDGALLEDNQKISGAVTRGMIDIMARSANGQMATRKDALDIVNKRKFNKGENYEFNAQVDPRQAFYMHTFPEIPNSAQYMLQQQSAEAEALTGVVPFSSSNSTQSFGDTATGVKSALDATSKRELGILRRLAQGIEEIGRKFISMNSEFLSDEEVIRITNEEFVTVRRDDLAGNIDIKLTISTPEADEQKAKELAFMLQTTGQTMGTEFSSIILSDIARLRKMPNLAKKIENFKPQPNPIEQEKAQLELELLKAQIANEQSKTMENQANAQLDSAKTNTENAKARNLGSDSDIKDLNFLEQEKGIKHNRERDKIELQGDVSNQKNINIKPPKGNNDSKNTTSFNGISSV